MKKREKKKLEKENNLGEKPEQNNVKEKSKKKETEKQSKETQNSEAKNEPKPKPKPKTLEEKYKDALREIEDLKKKRLYLQAEMENSQKIALKRIENSKFNIKVNVISSFLPIVDSFEAAISKYESTSKKDYEKLLDGVRSLQKQFLQVLNGLGIKPIDNINVPFNYKEHDVFMKMVDESQPEDTVIKIAHKGYYLGDNVLRPAKVIVSKKPDKSEAIPVKAEEVDTKEISNNKNLSQEEETESSSESTRHENKAGHNKAKYIS